MGRKREKGAVFNISVNPTGNYIIGNNSVVKGDILIGDDVVIGSMVLIEGIDIQIGDRTRIMPFAAIGSKTHIGQDCFLGPFFCHANTPDTSKGAKLFDMFIGDNCTFGANVMIQPGITIGKNVKAAMGAYIDINIPEGYYVPRVGMPRPRNDLSN